MIKTIYINSLEEISQVLLEQTFDHSIGRIRSDYLYRGMNDSSFSLVTSLKRNCGSLQQSLEPSMLRYYAKYAIVEDPDFSSSVWRQMVTGQHFGLPTRLLDWSHSALVALHFATSEEDMSMTDKRDGVVWRINEQEFTSLLPDKYKEVLSCHKTDVFSIDTLNSIVQNVEDYDKDMGNDSMVILEPPSSNQRIINQYSYFTVVPMGIEDIEDFLDKKTRDTLKIVISKDIRWDLRDLLDQLNISERTMYPGLDGLSRWIARHYYVKE